MATKSPDRHQLGYGQRPIAQVGHAAYQEQACADHAKPTLDVLQVLLTHAPMPRLPSDVRRSLPRPCPTGSARGAAAEGDTGPI